VLNTCARTYIRTADLATSEFNATCVCVFVCECVMHIFPFVVIAHKSTRICNKDYECFVFAGSCAGSIQCLDHKLQSMSSFLQTCLISPLILALQVVQELEPKHLMHPSRLQTLAGKPTRAKHHSNAQWGLQTASLEKRPTSGPTCGLASPVSLNSL
jgi:hypothetical protein